MKYSSIQNRLSFTAAVAAIAIVFAFAFSSSTSSVALTSGEEEGVIAQVETILATSARHVFDEDYWIANMHSIRSSQF